VSAAVIGVLVILWAVVLVPMWLRRHDKANELAAVDRFAGAMRVLSRRSGDRDRPAPGAGRYVVMPARSSAARTMDVFVPDKSGPVHTPGPELAAPRANGSRSSALARRVAARRRLAILMLTLVVTTLVAALVLGGALIAVQACVDVLVVAGVLHLRASVLAQRAQVRRAAGRASAVRVRAQARTRWAAEAHSYQVTERVQQAEPATVAVRGARGAAQPAAGFSAAVGAAPLGWPQAQQPSRPGSPRVGRRLPGEPVKRSATTAPAPSPMTAGWVAVSPAAVSPAPVSPAARGRTVDLTQPGKWSEAYAAGHAAPVAAKLPPPEAAVLDQPGYDDPITRQLLDEQRAEAAAPAETKARGAVFDEEDDELDRILRRAVGE